MNAAERLRQAAKMLRESATNATDGPWEASVATNPTYVAQVGHLAQRDPSYIASCGPASVGGWDNSEYIAMMHPGVALALADHMDILATNAETQAALNPGYEAAVQHTPGMRVADLILGGASS